MVLADIILLLSAFVLTTLIAMLLVRVVLARRVQARHERIKANLDWVNPIPQTNRKRKLGRR